jgi:hypothetical protein
MYDTEMFGPEAAVREAMTPFRQGCPDGINTKSSSIAGS